MGLVYIIIYLPTFYDKNSTKCKANIEISHGSVGDEFGSYRFEGSENSWLEAEHWGVEIVALGVGC